MNDDSDAYEFLRDGLLDLLDPDGDLDGDAAEESILLDAVKELHARAERAEAEVARLRDALDQAVELLRGWYADWGDYRGEFRSVNETAAFLAALAPDEGTEQ